MSVLGGCMGVGVRFYVGWRASKDLPEGDPLRSPGAPAAPVRGIPLDKVIPVHCRGT